MSAAMAIFSSLPRKTSFLWKSLADSPVFFTFCTAKMKSFLLTGRAFVPRGGKPLEVRFNIELLLLFGLPSPSHPTAFRDAPEVISLTGSHAAARQTSFRSLPLYPIVISATFGKNDFASGVMCCFSKNRRNSWSLELWFGNAISNDRGSRRKIAGSTSYGRLVAPRTIIGGVGNIMDDEFASSAFVLLLVLPLPSSSLSLLFGRSESKPSHNVKNSLFILFTALPSVPSL
mmetsp:Transcript_22328/g.36529  ORF Transcript_22328/g.36529 Transcript_22328/m.36529 type:complete len:231 (-) Transcript_22328:1020-1712(-)